MTPLQKYLKKNKPKTLDIDTFGVIMDDFLNANDVKLLIHSPEGSQDVSVQDNLGIGPVGTLFFLLKSICPVSKEIVSLTGEKWDAKALADVIADMVRDDILEGFGEAPDA